uniref:Uncharacterized protein n=1 Tax=Oryza sativa subsp. japonica TaxID=39947 RepID=Q6K4V4_ORYSJ|nr:hypothetical protein [Oryza sativa Japonica Group]
MSSSKSKSAITNTSTTLVAASKREREARRKLQEMTMIPLSSGGYAMVERWCGLVASMPSPAQRHAAGFVAKINDNSHSLPHLGRRGEKGKEAATLSLSLLAATLSRHCRASPSSLLLLA